MPTPRRRFSVAITETAEADLDGIAAYIAIDSPANAERFIRKLRAAILTLRTFPAARPLAPEGMHEGHQIRQLIVGRYRVLFTVRESVVIIHRVRHSARGWGPMSE